MNHESRIMCPYGIIQIRFLYGTGEPTQVCLAKKGIVGKLNLDHVVVSCKNRR